MTKFNSQCQSKVKANGAARNRKLFVSQIHVCTLLVTNKKSKETIFSKLSQLYSKPQKLDISINFWFILKMGMIIYIRVKELMKSLRQLDKLLLRSIGIIWGNMMLMSIWINILAVRKICDEERRYCLMISVLILLLKYSKKKNKGRN